MKKILIQPHHALKPYYQTFVASTLTLLLLLRELLGATV